MVLEDGFKTAPAEIKELKSTNKNGWYEVTLYEGHNQQIRKMFDAIGHSVVKLRRTAIGHIADKFLKSGEFRKLTVRGARQKFTRYPSKGPVETIEPSPTTPDARPSGIDPERP